MAEKGFGVKEINLIGPSGTPTITSPNNLNLNAVNVAISTNVSIGGTLSVTGNVSIGGTLTYEDVTNIDSVGLITARNGLNVTAGVSTFTSDIHVNGDIVGDGVTKLGSVSNSGRFSAIFLTDGSSYYGSNKLFVSSNSGFGLEAYGDMDSYLKANSGGGTSGNCYMRTGSSSGGYVFVNGDNGVELHHAGTSNKKFETTSSGATVTGTLTATTFSGSGASLTNLPATDPTNTDVQVVYAVTANGSSAYRFAGNGIVSTEDNPDVYLIRGLKYRFINNSGGSHPFQIRVSNGGSAYSSGVTNNGASSGNIDFQVPYSAPSHLYYQCTSHGGMVGNLYIRGAGGNNTNVGVTTFFTNDAGTTDLLTLHADADGTGANNGIASIKFMGNSNHAAFIKGGHTTNGDTILTFHTDAHDSGINPEERLRIHSNGYMSLGATNAPTKFGVRGTSGTSDATIQIVGNGVSTLLLGQDSDGGVIRGQGGNNALKFKVGGNGDAAARLGGTEALRIESDGDVVIGTTSASSKLHVHSAAHYVLTSSGVAHKHIHCSSVNGNANEYGGAISFSMGSTGAAAVAGLQGAADADNVGLAFITHNSGTGADNAQESARLTSDGNFLVATTSTTVNSANFGIVLGNDGSGGMFKNIGGTGDAFRAGGNQGLANIFGDGDITNTNNSYGQASDETLKQDIVDAASQWNDIKNLRVRKFRFKDNPTGVLQIGVVAQEIETVSAGLVQENEEGIKSVKYSVLYMKAVKALQESMARIEILETRLNNAGIAT